MIDSFSHQSSLKHKEIPTEGVIDLLDGKESDEAEAEEFVGRTEVLFAVDLVEACDIFEHIAP